MNYLVVITIAFSLIMYTTTGIAQTSQTSQSQSLATLPGLKRFNSNASLGARSTFEIKSVHIGDNALEQAQRLQSEGGKVHYISGGSRSRNVKVSFYQPYQNSQLDQRFKLDFDKENGFINGISVTYKFDSAYLDIQPVYQQVLQNAVEKYGEPLSMQQVRDIAKVPAKDVLLAAFSGKLQVREDVEVKVRAFFDTKIIASRTRFIEETEGRAVLQSGFNECYFWPGDGYVEILSLCAFRKSKVNMKGQTVQMSLVSFLLEDKIKQYQSPENAEVEIAL